MNVSEQFLSTPSARRATSSAGSTPSFRVISIHALREEGDILRRAAPASLAHFYPRPPRGGRPAGPGRLLPHGDFYPRPPRGGRHQEPRQRQHYSSISIHALREEGDQPPEFVLLVFIVFLSTPSARRATGRGVIHGKAAHDFYPRPPRGGRHPLAAPMRPDNLFLSTPSARRATRRGTR